MLDKIYLLAGTIILILITIGAGNRVGRIFDRKGLSNIPLCFFVGEVILSFIFILATTWLLFPRNIVIFMIIATPFLYYGYEVIKNVKYKISRYGYSEIFIVVILLLALSLNFIRVFLKPVAWDDVVYHHPVMKELASGNLHFPLLRESPFIDFQYHFSQLFGNLPYASESYSAILFNLAGQSEHSAQMVNFINVVFFVVFLYQFLKKRYLFKRSVILSVITFILLWFEAFQIISTGYVDMTIYIFQTISIIMLVNALPNRKYSYYLLSFLFLSYSFGMKYTALYLFPPYLLATTVSLIKQKVKIRTGFIVKLITVAIIGCGYWYLKNIIINHNPTYPFFFGHSGMTEFNYEVMILQTYYSLQRSLASFTTMLKEVYFNNGFLVVTAPMAVVGLVLDIRKKKYLAILMGMGIWLMVLNYFRGSQITRFELLFPLSLILLSSIVLNKLRFIILVMFILLLGMWANSPTQKYYFEDTLKRTLREITDGAYQGNIGTNCFGEINQILMEKNKQALNFWDPYAATFYANTNRFYNFKGQINYDNFNIPDSVNYLYINESLKAAFENQKDFHADIYPEKRLVLGNKLIRGKVIVYQKEECILYKIK